MMIKLGIDKKIIAVLSCYAPQVGLDNIIKNTLYNQLQDTVKKVNENETLVICGEHIGKHASG